MHSVNNLGKWLLVGTTAAALAFVPGTAVADKSRGDGSQGNVKSSGKRDGNTLTSLISYSGSTRGTSGKSSGGFTPTGNWTPPACWYEPRTAAEFKKYIEGMYTSTVNAPGMPNYAKTSVAQYRDIYKDGKYKDYNLDKADEGAFWVSVQDEDRWDEPGAWTCSELPFWVKTGDTPPVQNSVTPDVLAQLAYNQVDVPETKVSLAPANNTKVNLPTWAWLDNATFKPVSVTASLNAGGVNLQSTVTATPVSLRIQPGTKDATLHPGSGECTFQNGHIGTPYAKGDADKTPSCGVTYLRSSGSGSYQLRATLTWNVTWTGSGGAGGTLPTGTFGTTQDIAVQEIQAINR
ncbi:hypothetical protein ACGFZA_00535 [Streptomyces sp. NPDC048211]|uniref:hypothetical protein n=1 Tax=Streptomyces sp. NPDC048211 TaxID=3365516 RepID=UPI00371A4A1C